MNSYYGSVNGPSCHYKKLATYSKCSEAEVTAVAVPTTTDFKFVPTTTLAPTTLAPTTSAPAATGGAGETFKYRSSEGFEESGATGAPETTAAPAEPAVKPEYTPSYSVPNYPPINIESLTYGGRGCAGYPSIIDAYSGGGMMSSAGSCTTNFINN
jgi:hypothetical protein